jgi:hypothetical protein
MNNMMKNRLTSGSYSSSDEDRATSSSEHLQGLLTLALSAVTVNGGGGEALVDEEVGQRVSHTLGLDEDQGKTSTVGVEDIQENRALVNVLDVLNLLGNVLRSGTDTTNRKENVVLQEITGKHLNVAGESGREHECLTASGRRHILTLNDAANLRLETHVQHAVSLVKNKVLDASEGDTATLDQVDKTAGGSNKKIAAALDLAKLGANVGTTVDDTRADPRAVGELAGFVEDLGDQLTGRSKDERGGVGLALTSIATLSLCGGRRGAVLEGLGENGEEETTSLSGTSLGTSHEITTTHDDGNRVLLYGCGNLVSRELDVAQQVVIERRVCETCDGLGNTLTRGLDGDIVVLLEVDTGVLLGGIVGHAKEVALQTLVGRAGNVLAVLPGTVTRSASTSRATAAGLAVGAGIEVAARGTAPSTTTLRTVAAAGSEVGCVGPATGTTAAVHLRGRTLTSWSPGAATETTAVHLRRRAVHRGRASGTALGTTAKVRGDVGRTLAVEAVLIVVLRVVYVETTHVELVSHDGRG